MRQHRVRRRKQYGWPGRAIYRAVAEALEPRRLLSTYIVTTGNDDAGNVAPTATGTPGVFNAVTLRDAISAVNAAGGTNVIDYNQNGFDLNNGPLEISSSGQTQIDGPGTVTGIEFGFPNVSIVSFRIDQQATVTLSNLHIQNGAVAVQNFGTASLVDCTISGNDIVGIQNNSGLLSVFGSTINGNNGIGGNTGGGLYNNNGTATIANSTIAGNSGGDGSGIGNIGKITVTDCTITANTDTVAGVAAGIVTNGIATLQGNIIYGNTTKGAAADLSKANSSPKFTGDHNLVGVDLTGSFTNNDSGHDLVGVNPLLGAFNNYGGATSTYPLLPGSPAIDAGAVFSAAAGVDQRGLARPQGAAPDIGAFESLGFTPRIYIVNTAGDDRGNVFPTATGTSGTYNAVTLRDAVNASAFAFDSSVTIQFLAGFFGSFRTIALTNGPLTIIDGLGDTNIVGSGVNQLTINGGGEGTIFSLSAIANAQISGLSIVNAGKGGAAVVNNGILAMTQVAISGSADGGISNSNLLTMNQCLVTGSAAGGGISGGVINLVDSTISGNAGTGISSNENITLYGCTISGNSGPKYYPGGVNAYNLTAVDCTIAGNSGSYGGGIVLHGAGSVVDCTIVGNSSSSDGGGIELVFAEGLSLEGSIVYGNTGFFAAEDLSGGEGGQITGGHNLIGVDQTGSFINGDAGHDLVGVNPLLGPLADYGGPTQTMALLAGSPAIGAGAVFAAAGGVDQRGFARPAQPDIGAYQSGGSLTVTSVGDGENVAPGTMSLRGAIDYFNLVGGVHTVAFGAPLFSSPQTILLRNGQLNINAPITIPGGGDVFIFGNETGRIFQINPGVNAQLSGLTIAGGVPSGAIATGGGVLNDGGTLTVANCTVSACSVGLANVFGGVLMLSNSTLSGDNTSFFNTGDATITNSTVEQDQTDAVFNNGILNVSGSTLDSNGGVAIRNHTGTVSVINSTISGNHYGGIASGFSNALFGGLLTVAGCNVTDNGSDLYSDGGIFCHGSTGIITDSVISGNQGSYGAVALYAFPFIGNLTITGCTITGNSGRYDGAVYARGTTTISDCIISGNSGGNAGAIKVFHFNTTTITNTTISGNSGSQGGGIEQFEGSNLIVVNSTISGNTATNRGGAIYSNGAMTVVDSTINGNTCTNTYNPDKAGGIYSNGYATTHLYGTIITGNIQNGIQDDLDVASGASVPGFSGNHNLIGVDNSHTFTNNDAGHDKVGVNALLAPLADYGGPTQTIALLPGSPAIGGGAVFGQAGGLDQRGMIRPSTPDIGAFQSGDSFTVNTADDGTSVPLGDVSLRAALDYFSAIGGTHTVAFALSVFSTAQTITLDHSPLLISNVSGQIDVPAPSAGLTINADGYSRVLYLDAGASATISGATLTGGAAGFTLSGGDVENLGTLSLVNCNITNGSASSGDAGGAIENNGRMTITNSTISGNAEGGIANDPYAVLAVSGSTFSGNTLDPALFNTGIGVAGGSDSGTATIVNCTFSGNSGGSITNLGSLIVTDSTISGNTSGQKGAGIYGFNTATLDGVIVFGNTRNGVNDDLDGPSKFTGNHNLIGVDTSGSFTNNDANHDKVGVNPLLGPLANNSGPTETMALLPGSPAIDAGAVFAAAGAVDQRGVARPQGAAADIGAYEFQTGVVIFDGVFDAVNWNKALNWSTEQVPTSASQVIVPAGFSVQVAAGTFGAHSFNSSSPITILPGALLNLVGPSVLNGALTIQNGGTIDIAAGSLAINYGVGNASPLSLIQGYVGSGYNGGTWTGMGIRSSTAAAHSGDAVGYADGSVDSGTAALAGQVLIRYTQSGDGNLDGLVNFSDLVAIVQNFNKGGTDWAHGNFLFGSSTSFGDLVAVVQNFNKTLTPPATTSGEELGGTVEPLGPTAPVQTAAAKLKSIAVNPIAAETPAAAPTSDDPDMNTLASDGNFLDAVRQDFARPG